MRIHANKAIRQTEVAIRNVVGCPVQDDVPSTNSAEVDSLSTKSPHNSRTENCAEARRWFLQRSRYRERYRNGKPANQHGLSLQSNGYPSAVSELSHTDDQGNARMVDVSDKQPTERRAVAEGFLRYTDEHWRALRNLPKGDALTVAQIAGILGAKRTSDLIPMCHPIPLSHVDVDLNPTAEGIEIRATTKTADRTGVEMEALTAVAIAALTLFDMLKSVSSDMTIERVRLMEKTGGKQNWKRSEESDSQS
ncbi:MAG: hypothetical protein KatS3mg015_0651 [Fimbriimonadales bacterium]|nr:MAG: hypothetical protein KatS3mg015_0651 [Fimbriimonadales bacterium]